jgi:hypothetical protein
VLHEARKIYEFEVRGLRVEADRVSFYINAVDGFAAILLNREQLPQKPFRFRKIKKNTFFAVLSRWVKAYPLAIALGQWGKFFPKTLRGGLRMGANRALVLEGRY